MSRHRNNLYDFEGFRLDAGKQRLLRAGEPIPLPPKAVELLLLLIENHQHVVEKEFLMESLWHDTFVEESNLTQNVYLLRKALGKTSDGRPFIETFSKRGYKFVPDVRTVTADEDALVVSKMTKLRAVITQEEIEDDVEQSEAIKVAPPAGIETAKPLAALPARIQTRTILNRKAVAAVMLALTAGVGIYFVLSNLNKRNATAQIKSIAVMPFKTIGAEGQEEFLGLGMADAIITRLGKTGKIAVSPTEAVRRYGEKGTDPLSAARALGAEAVLTGNVQRVDERMRVTVQLLRVGDGQFLWTDRFDEKFTDIFTMQDLISQRLAGALTLRLSGDERQRLTKNHTENVEAYRLYLQGRFYWAKRTPEWVQKAIVCFEQAARLDPNYAMAYAGLADSYAITASGLPPNERMPRAKAAALRALSIDESLAEAHTSLAFILYKFEWNWLEAENHFRRAIQLNPNYAVAHHWFGECLGLMGRFDEGLTELKEAERLDPLSLSIKTDVGRILYRARRYDEALAQSRKTLELEPNFRNAHVTIMWAYQQKEMYAEAVEADLQALRLSRVPPEKIEELRGVFAASGWKGYWRERLELTQERARSEYVPFYEFAEIHLRLGEKEEAFRMLEKSYEERGDGPLYVRAEPPLDPLRSDPRFDYLVRRSGLVSN